MKFIEISSLLLIFKFKNILSEVISYKVRFLALSKLFSNITNNLIEYFSDKTTLTTFEPLFFRKTAKTNQLRHHVIFKLAREVTHSPPPIIP